MKSIFGGRYNLEDKIGKGSYGEIVGGREADSGKEVAVKLEPTQSERPMLKHECLLYNKLLKAGAPRCPKVYLFGKQGGHHVMVMERLYDSVESLFQKCGQSFTVETASSICYHILESLECLHRIGYIHRDVKPENFLMKKGEVYLIDYGLAKRYRLENGSHIPFNTGRSLLGTARYASINSHAGYELSRRDDLESLIYVLIYFIKGSLPWQKATGNTRKVKYRNIHQIKRSTPIRELTRGLPEQIYNMCIYVRSLDFSEKPNYRYLRQMLDSMTGRKMKWDWQKLGINP